MTTTITPPESTRASGNPLRLLDIAADLLPAEITQARRDRRARTAVLAVLASVLVLLAAWYGLASYQAVAARTRLASAQRDVAAVQAQQREYAALTGTQARSAAIAARLSALLANDLPWSTLLAALQAAAPAGLSVTAVSGALNATGATGSGAGAGPAGAKPTTSPSATPIGTLSVSGVAPDKAAAAGYVDALARIAGLADPLVVSAATDETGVHFTVQLVVTGAARGGRYTTATGSAGR